MNYKSRKADATNVVKILRLVRELLIINYWELLIQCFRPSSLFRGTSRSSRWCEIPIAGGRFEEQTSRRDTSGSHSQGQGTGTDSILRKLILAHSWKSATEPLTTKNSIQEVNLPWWQWRFERLECAKVFVNRKWLHDCWNYSANIRIMILKILSNRFFLFVILKGENFL